MDALSRDRQKGKREGEKGEGGSANSFFPQRERRIWVLPEKGGGEAGAVNRTSHPGGGGGIGEKKRDLFFFAAYRGKQRGHTELSWHGKKKKRKGGKSPVCLSTR